MFEECKFRIFSSAEVAGHGRLDDFLWTSSLVSKCVLGGLRVADPCPFLFSEGVFNETT